MAKQQTQKKVTRFMNQVTLKHGISGVIKKEVPDGTTVGQLLADQSIKAVLGYGESVTVVSNGETLSLNDEIEAGDVLIIEKQAAAKAA